MSKAVNRVRALVEILCQVQSEEPVTGHKILGGSILPETTRYVRLSDGSFAFVDAAKREITIGESVYKVELTRIRARVY